jgi:hypothetical protein
MLTARLPSDDMSAPPDVPTTFIVGAPSDGVLEPPPQPTAASVNEQKIDVWSRRRVRMVNLQSVAPPDN